MCVSSPRYIPKIYSQDIFHIVYLYIYIYIYIYIWVNYYNSLSWIKAPNLPLRRPTPCTQKPTGSGLFQALVLKRIRHVPSNSKVQTTSPINIRAIRLTTKWENWRPRSLMSASSDFQAPLMVTVLATCNGVHCRCFNCWPYHRWKSWYKRVFAKGRPASSLFSTKVFNLDIQIICL